MAANINIPDLVARSFLVLLQEEKEREGPGSEVGMRVQCTSKYGKVRIFNNYPGPGCSKAD